MDSENARLAGALFHTLRSVYREDPRRREKYGDPKCFREALSRRARREEAARRFADKLARWEWERGFD